MKTFLRLAVLKLVSLLLVGTCWAQVDKVDAMAHAIARQEGFYIKHTIPNRLHNPGDITAVATKYPGQVGVYRGYAVFKNDRYGWAALRNQIQKIIDGTSKTFDQSMTFAQIAKVYAEDKHWGVVVCKILKITPQTTFQEYFGLAPRVKFTEAQWPTALRNMFNHQAPLPSVDTLNPTYAESVGNATPANTSTSNVLTAGGSDALIFAGIQW